MSKEPVKVEGFKRRAPETGLVSIKVYRDMERALRYALRSMGQVHGSLNDGKRLYPEAMEKLRDAMDVVVDSLTPIS